MEQSKLDPLSGIIPRSTFRIFDALEERTKAGEIEASVQASFLEICALSQLAFLCSGAHARECAIVIAEPCV